MPVHRTPVRSFARLLGIAFLVVLLAACPGSGSSGGGVTVTVGNRAPMFTSPAAVSVAEDTAGVFYTATASDPDGNAVTFSLMGGEDVALFRMTSAGGVSFASPPR